MNRSKSIQNRENKIVGEIYEVRKTKRVRDEKAVTSKEDS